MKTQKPRCLKRALEIWRLNQTLINETTEYNNIIKGYVMQKDIVCYDINNTIWWNRHFYLQSIKKITNTKRSFSTAQFTFLYTTSYIVSYLQLKQEKKKYIMWMNLDSTCICLRSFKKLGGIPIIDNTTHKKTTINKRMLGFEELMSHLTLRE